MLRVYWASGKLALALEPEEFARVAAGPSPVRGLKEHLQSQCKRSRFRQRLLRDGALLGEDATLELPLELQLVILPFSHATDLQITELRRAVERDQLPEVEAILQRPQDADLSVARDWTTALHVAAEHGFVAAARLLQEACADVDRPDIVGSTPLLVAAKNGHLSMARWLLEARADLNAKCFPGGRSFGPTPLFMAALTGRLEVARLLLDARADKEKSEAHSTPLFVASPRARTAFVGSQCQQRQHQRGRGDPSAEGCGAWACGRGQAPSRGWCEQGQGRLLRVHSFVRVLRGRPIGGGATSSGIRS